MNKAVRFFVAAILLASSLTCAPRDDGGGGTKGPGGISVQPEPNINVPAGLKARIDATVDHVKSRDLLTTHGFWTIFHGILGNGLDTTLLDTSTGKKVNAIEFIRNGGPLRGMQFNPSSDGLDVQLGPLFIGQGHQDQFVAEMLQWGLPADAPFKVNGKDYKFEDFLRFSRAKARVTANQELSWAIIIIGQHYGTKHEWTNSAGETLHFENVVRYEVDQPIKDAACGGTHRLFGLTWAYHLHLQNGGKKTGVWKDVADRLNEHKALARKLQNKDGSFSTDYFNGPGNAPDHQTRVGTTGHILEWLALAMTDDELKETWVQDAVNALCLMILEARMDPVDGGSLYHATHGLQIYRSRVFGPRIPILPLSPKT